MTTSILKPEEAIEKLSALHVRFIGHAMPDSGIRARALPESLKETQVGKRLAAQSQKIASEARAKELGQAMKNVKITINAILGTIDEAKNAAQKDAQDKVDTFLKQKFGESTTFQEIQQISEELPVIAEALDIT